MVERKQSPSCISKRIDQTVYGRVDQTVDRCFFLVSIKMYFPPQYSHGLFVKQQFLDQPFSVKKPSPRWR